MSIYEQNAKLLTEGKDISELTCIYSLEEIQSKVKEMYPTLDEKEVNYHAHHIIDNDWLKVCDVEEEFEKVVKEQVEPEED